MDDRETGVNMTKEKREREIGREDDEQESKRSEISKRERMTNRK